MAVSKQFSDFFIHNYMYMTLKSKRNPFLMFEQKISVGT